MEEKRIQFDSDSTIEDIDLDQEVIHVTGADGKPVRYTNAMAEADADEGERLFAERSSQRRSIRD